MDNRNSNLFGIFRSKVRTTLLVQFFINEEKEFYVQQLARDLKTPASLIHREIKNLESNTLITSRPLGNMIMYKVDKNGPFYQEIKDLTLKLHGIEQLIKPIVNPEKDIIACFIYGSYARGDFDASSDIDILVLAQKNQNLYEKLSSKLSKLEETLGREINMDYFLLLELKHRIKTKDPYISDVLKNRKIFIKGGETEFRFPNGQKTTS